MAWGIISSVPILDQNTCLRIIEQGFSAPGSMGWENEADELQTGLPRLKTRVSDLSGCILYDGTKKDVFDWIGPTFGPVNINGLNLGTGMTEMAFLAFMTLAKRNVICPWSRTVRAIKLKTDTRNVHQGSLKDFTSPKYKRPAHSSTRLTSADILESCYTFFYTRRNGQLRPLKRGWIFSRCQ